VVECAGAWTPPRSTGIIINFKTLWGPELILMPAQSAPIEASLAADVLGSIPYKVPICGEASSERAGAWRVQFAIDGLFDKALCRDPNCCTGNGRLSSMSRPGRVVTKRNCRLAQLAL